MDDDGPRFETTYQEEQLARAKQFDRQDFIDASDRDKAKSLFETECRKFGLSPITINLYVDYVYGAKNFPMMNPEVILETLLFIKPETEKPYVLTDLKKYKNRLTKRVKDEKGNVREEDVVSKEDMMRYIRYINSYRKSLKD